MLNVLLSLTWWVHLTYLPTGSYSCLTFKYDFQERNTQIKPLRGNPNAKSTGSLGCRRTLTRLFHFWCSCSMRVRVALLTLSSSLASKVPSIISKVLLKLSTGFSLGWYGVVLTFHAPAITQFFNQVRFKIRASIVVKVSGIAIMTYKLLPQTLRNGLGFLI